MVIEGKLALITGASSGIGEATAREIAGGGGRVILVARSASRLQQVAAEISATGGRADYYPMDLAMPDAVGALVSKIVRDVGTPDILVNNAGAGRWLTIEETGARELQEMMALPYFAAFNLTRELLPRMRQRGSGHIVNIVSVACRLIWPGAAGYSAARAAMAAFSKALETETHGLGIHVTLGIFGKVASTYWEHNPGSEERLPKVDAYLPTLTPQRVARAVVAAIKRESGLIVLPRAFKFIFFVNALYPKMTSKILRWGWRKGSF
ncbi:MAG TPA: SDR family NAD(P)-dependent oxidoreductase [Syntrophobacteraceae bacterium]|nr:SDR family NAD(P)-dependent oxidoreductase [Syntrophobacteraceae bacterium]